MKESGTFTHVTGTSISHCCWIWHWPNKIIENDLVLETVSLYWLSWKPLWKSKTPSLYILTALETTMEAKKWVSLHTDWPGNNYGSQRLGFFTYWLSWKSVWRPHWPQNQQAFPASASSSLLLKAHATMSSKENLWPVCDQLFVNTISLRLTWDMIL